MANTAVCGHGAVGDEAFWGPAPSCRAAASLTRIARTCYVDPHILVSDTTCVAGEIATLTIMVFRALRERGVQGKAAAFT